MLKVADFEDKTDEPEVSLSEPVKRKRGRPKGLPKTGGRQKATKNWTHPEIRDALLERSDAVQVLADIVAGRQLHVSGPTGKEYWARPTMQERLRATELLLKKILPDLQAVEMTGKDGEPLMPPQAEQDPRQLSRAILQVLGEAVLDDGGQERQQEDAIPHGKHEYTAQRYEPVDEVAALDLSPEVPDPAPPPVPEPDQVGDKLLIGDRGCYIECVQVFNNLRWSVHDGYGTHHGNRRTKAEAEALAATLNGPTLPPLLRTEREAARTPQPDAPRRDEMIPAGRRIPQAIRSRP